MASDTTPRHAPVKPYLRDRVRAQAIELLPRRGSFPPNLLPSGGLKATQRAHSPYFLHTLKLPYKRSFVMVFSPSRRAFVSRLSHTGSQENARAEMLWLNLCLVEPLGCFLECQ